MNYVEAVQRAGGLALLVPPDPALVEDPGAAPRPPRRPDADRRAGRGRRPLRRRGPPAGRARGPAARRGRDRPRARGHSSRGLPLLGICRGMQLINVAAGGTLRQHLPGRARRRARTAASLGSLRRQRAPRATSTRARAPRASAGESPHGVISHHHQGVARLGDGPARHRPAPRATGCPRRSRATGPAWALGVQWHPEADPDSRVIAGLVAAARDRLVIGGRAWTGKKGATLRSPPLAATNGADPVGSALHSARGDESRRRRRPRSLARCPG